MALGSDRCRSKSGNTCELGFLVQRALPPGLWRQSSDPASGLTEDTRPRVRLQDLSLEDVSSKTTLDYDDTLKKNWRF